MKKYIFILLSLVMTLGLGLGCSERLDVPDAGTAEGETCLNFSVAVPEQGSATRAALGENLSTLWVLVFDDNGFFVEAKQATPVNAFSMDENTEYKFKVTLQASPSRRTLHFVANRDFSGSNYPEYNNEYYLISHLTVKNTDSVPVTYWQRVVLEDGIPADIADFAASDLEKISKIPLVRNFAKVTVASSTPNFIVDGFALVNVPDRGSVAPCVMTASDFAVYPASDDDGDVYGNNPWISRSYDDLSSSYDGSASSAGFSGFLPADVTIDQTLPTVFSPDPEYMYERPYSGDDTNTAIVVKGRYNPTGSTDASVISALTRSYFKIDFVKESDPENGFNVYYNILRNFNYEVDIRSCKSDGYASVAEAVKAPSMNNFLFSVDTQDYSNISDGTARIFVEYTEKTIVSSDAFEFKLKYVPDIKNAPTTYDNFSVKVRDKDSKQEFLPGNSYSSSESSVVNTISVTKNTDADGWVTFSVKPQDLPSSGELTQSVVFYVLDGSSTTELLVARTVILHLRKPSEMKINMAGESGIPLSSGAEFLMNLYIPSGLNKSVFPLEFKIESATNNLTPDSSLNADEFKSGYMSTWYGTSVSPSGAAVYGKQTFGFTKSITYDEYNALASDSGKSYRILPCAFKTTKTTTAGKNTIYVSNPYFTPDPTTYSVEKL